MLSFKLPCLWSFFPTQGLNPGLLHCGQIPYCLSHQGSPFCHGSPSEYIDIRHRVQEGFVILIICRLRVAQLSLMGCKLLEGRDTEPSSALVLGSLRELPEWVLGSSESSLNGFWAPSESSLNGAQGWAFIHVC